MKSKCDRCGEVVESIDAGFSPGLHEMRHDCGGTWREVPARYTLIEYMPLHLRARHVEARNSGRYPGNGAERAYVEGDVPETELDPRWASIVKTGVRLPAGETALAGIPDEALPPVSDDAEEP